MSIAQGAIWNEARSKVVARSRAGFREERRVDNITTLRLCMLRNESILVRPCVPPSLAQKSPACADILAFEFPAIAAIIIDEMF
jgi:hypothetical protein